MPPPPVQTPRERLRSLDVFRGATIAAMILVNTPGSWDHVYAPLLHAEWHGLTPTDLVFPNFVFIVGVSLVLSLGRGGWAGERTPEQRAALGATAAKVTRRVALIFAVGLALNGFPFFHASLSELRIHGVLQRIALAYGLAAAIALAVPRRGWLPATAALLLGSWALIAWGAPGPDPYALTGNLQRAVDLATVGADHMYTGFGIAFDPEGLVGTLATAATALLGAHAGSLIQRAPTRGERVAALLRFGLVLAAIGVLWGTVLLINKPLWTASYACLTAGIASVLLAGCTYAVDGRAPRRWAAPFVHFGVNPLAVYVLSGLIVRVLIYVLRWEGSGGDPVNAYGWLWREVYASLPVPPKLASLAFAATVVALCWGFAYALWRRQIVIKL